MGVQGLQGRGGSKRQHVTVGVELLDLVANHTYVLRRQESCNWQHSLGCLVIAGRISQRKKAESLDINSNYKPVWGAVSE